MVNSSDAKSAEARDGHRLNAWEAWIGMTVGGLLLAIGPTIISLAVAEIIGSQDPGSHRASWRAGLFVAVGCVLLIGGAILVARLQHLSNKAARQSALDITKYNDALSGLHRAVGRLLSSDASEMARREFFRSVVGSASQLFPLEGVRVCVYELDSADNSPDKDQNDQAALKYVDSGGRHDEPRKEFTNDSQHGRKAIETAQGTQHRCVVDADETQDVDRPSGSTWQSFMQVPLRLHGKAIGLLSVDCRDRVNFTKDHVTIAHAAASLIVLGMGELKRAAVDVNPELQETLNRVRQLGSLEARADASARFRKWGGRVETNGTKDGDHDA